MKPLSEKKKRWLSPLLHLVLLYFTFETFSGLLPFFLGELINKQSWITAHSLAGVILCPVYLLYQWRHYQRNLALRNSFQYKLGLWTLASIWITIISGIVLYGFIPASEARWLDLTHIIASFAFLLLLFSHLTVALRRLLP